MATTFRSLYLTRWRILQRDRFTCQYCGQAAPDVILHVDHRIPRSQGGSDSDANLVTCCWACNIGKSDWLDSLQSKPCRANGKPSTASAIADYLAEHGPATATELARAIGYNRANVSRVLTTDRGFRFTEKRGRDALYDLVQRPAPAAKC